MATITHTLVLTTTLLFPFDGANTSSSWGGVGPVEMSLLIGRGVSGGVSGRLGGPPPTPEEALS